MSVSTVTERYTKRGKPGKPLSLNRQVTKGYKRLPVKCSVFARGGTTRAHIEDNTDDEVSEETLTLPLLRNLPLYAEVGISFTISMLPTSPYHCKAEAIPR